MNPPSSKPAGRLWAPDFPFAPARSPWFYGWTMVMAGTLAIFASIPGQTMGVGVFTDHLMASLGLSRTQISLAYLVGTLASGFILPSAGRLYDLWGARKLAVLSTATLGLALLFLSVSPTLTRWASALMPATYAAFLTMTLGFFAIRFMGQGLLTLTGRNAIAKWFDRKRGIAVGISGVLMSFGFSASPQFLDWLIARFGWQNAWFVLGLLLIGGFSLIFWLLFRDNPEECGLEMDGGVSTNAKAETNLDLIIHRAYTRVEALRTLSFWVFNLSFGFQALAITAYTFHVVDIGESINVDRETILSLFLYGAFFSVGTNLLTGWLSARTRVKYLLAVENVLAGLFWVSLLIIPQVRTAGLALLVIGMGVSGGIWGNLMGIVFARFFGRVHLGAISGVTMSTMVIASAIGPYCFGLIKDLFGSYEPAFLGSIAVAALLAVLSFRADNPQRNLSPQDQ